MPDLKTALELALQKSRVLDQWDDDDVAHRTPEAQHPPAPTLTPVPTPETPSENTMQTTTTEKPMRHIGNITNNITRTTFDSVKLYPNMRRSAFSKQIAAKHGFNLSSVSAIITQLMKAHYVAQKDDDTLVPLVAEYTPIRSSVKRQALVRPGRKPTVVKRKRSVQPEVAPAEVKESAGIAGLPQPVATLPLITRAEPVAPLAPFTITASYILDNMSVRHARELYVELHKIFGA